MSKTKQPETPPLDTDPGRATRGVTPRESQTDSEMVPDTPDPPPAEDDVHYEVGRAAGVLHNIANPAMVVTGPTDRIANAMERAVTLLEEIHAAIQPQEEADEVLDPDAGLVMLQATTPDGVARSYVVRTGSTKAAWEAACSAWDCDWRELRGKSGKMEE